MAVAQDLRQQLAQLGDVPLTVAQLVDEAALRLFFRGMEVTVEGSIGRADSQALVEDHEWLSQSRNDALGVVEGVLQFMRQLGSIVRSHLALHPLSLFFRCRGCPENPPDIISGDRAGSIDPDARPGNRPFFSHRTKTRIHCLCSDSAL
jgi:hypothetical protein